MLWLKKKSFFPMVIMMNTDLLVYEATAIRYVLRADLDMTTPDLP
jgi:hypothetical protein